MPSIMFWLLSILTEETDVPFIGCQSKGQLLTLKFLRKRGFSRARKSNHQMESRHIYAPGVSGATKVAVNLDRISKSSILQFMPTTTCLSIQTFALKFQYHF